MREGERDARWLVAGPNGERRVALNISEHDGVCAAGCREVSVQIDRGEVRVAEKRDGEWRIASRRVAMEWMPEEMDESPLGPGGYKLANFAPTRYDASDPSYERS